MFSATFPKGARIVAKEYMANDHIRIRVGRTGSTHLNVAQNVSRNSALINPKLLTHFIGGLRRRTKKARLSLRSSSLYATFTYDRVREQQEGSGFFG